MSVDRFGAISGILLVLAGMFQAWRPGEAARMGSTPMPAILRPDLSNDLWLIRLAGIVACLGGLGVLIASLRSA